MASPVGIAFEELVERYPRLYHVTSEGSWDGIRRHGLLSTTALLDRFEVTSDTRQRLQSHHRPHSVEIAHQSHGVAVIRDQKPMDDSGLRRALRDGITPQAWYELLNRHVFFWLDYGRVERLIKARAYRTTRQTLIVAKTKPLLRQYWDQTVLSPLNTGATKPMPHPRGLDCFVTPGQYPFRHLLRKRGAKNAIVELSIKHAVPDIVDFTERVLLIGGQGPQVDIWKEDSGDSILANRDSAVE